MSWSWVNFGITGKLMVFAYILVNDVDNICISFPSHCADDRVVTFDFKNPTHVRRGTLYDFDLHFHVKSGWYIYAPTGNNEVQGVHEVKLMYTLPEGFERVGKITGPTPILKDGFEVLTGDDIPIVQEFKAGAQVRSGIHKIKCRLVWQACNSICCLPPGMEEFEISILVK